MEPGERGATRIADRVVAKIASQAAREALRSGGAADAGADTDTGTDPGEVALADAVGARPYAVAAVRGGVARVRVAVELGYPSDIGARCGAVRRHVIERVGELTGMEVPEVAVTVERLHMPRWERPERGARRGRDRVR
ncbi:Asp23/Gls24 family envelope stress response protein [Streptomyces rugosispiralis]|uniref:Asp23/Gls24 family envelope stress response protein n=1 Tax=Streptomyces rugosispiralis TaxID=2967341 RepID=A0ABT1UVC8_9ACTN|nr:Asp23/Gls24 family envelope stress response protein [Streptomyces rugosispiralis]MCQ8189071.1 Asp23/Gls24 family envelope stress response protein [Streptomyces rugosispiralis]